MPRTRRTVIEGWAITLRLDRHLGRRCAGLAVNHATAMVAYDDITSGEHRANVAIVNAASAQLGTAWPSRGPCPPGRRRVGRSRPLEVGQKSSAADKAADLRDSAADNAVSCPNETGR